MSDTGENQVENNQVENVENKVENTAENAVDNRIDLGPIVQVGIIVYDAQAACDAWTSRFKIDPPHIVDWPIPGKNLEGTATYHGKPANFKMRLAFLQLGPVQIEFIEPQEGDNIYSDFLEAQGEGLHHILFEAEDPAAIIEGIGGAPVLQSGGSSLRPGATWSYLDTQEMLKVMVELRTKL